MARTEIFSGEEVEPYLPYVQQLEEIAQETPIGALTEFTGEWFTRTDPDGVSVTTALITIKHVPNEVTRGQVKNWIVNKTAALAETDFERQQRRALAPKKQQFLQMLEDPLFVDVLKTALGV